jgi:DNA polymerase-4
VIQDAALRLLEGVDTTTGVRLLGVGVSGLADFTQEDLFAQAAPRPRERRPETAGEPPAAPAPAGEPARRWPPGVDVSHERYGPGWVQGSGSGRVTVRFERPGSPPGRVRTFAVDDPLLGRSQPLPLVAPPGIQPSGGEASRPKSPPDGASSSGPPRGTSRP